MIRDLMLFTHSVINSGLSNELGGYWDSTNKEDLQTLVKRLSNIMDPERGEIRRLLKEHGPSSILDAGCGPGTEKRSYDTFGIQVEYVGLDGSDFMLDIAKRRHPNDKFVKGDIENIPFEDNSFDAVLVKHVLEHLLDYKTAVQEALRVSKDIVIIDFFHRLLPVGFDVHLKDRRGFWNNWYSRSRFEKFLGSSPISYFNRTQVKGSVNQTADIYVLKK